MFQPVCSCTFCSTMRVPLSVMPAGVYGTTQRIGFDGQACALAPAVHASAIATAAAFSFMSLIYRLLLCAAILNVTRAFDRRVGEQEFLVHLQAEARFVDGPHIAVLVD